MAYYVIVSLSIQGVNNLHRLLSDLTGIKQVYSKRLAGGKGVRLFVRRLKKLYKRIHVTGKEMG
jgi:hypothetical protein